MRAILAIAAEEWRRTRPISRWTLILLPTLLSLLIMGIYIHGVLADLPTVVVDMDHSALSRQVVRMMSAHRYLSVTSEPDDPEEAFAMLRRHEAFVAAVIPAGFERDVLRGDQGRIQVTHFGANMMVGKTVLKTMTEIVTELNAKIAAGRLMAMRGESAFTRQQTPSLMVDYHNLYNPTYNYLWMLPAGVIATLWQMFVIIWAINAALGGGIPQRRPLRELAGRLLIPAAIMTAHWLVLFYVLHPLCGVPVRGAFIHGLADWLLFLFSCLLLGYCAALLTRNQMGASVFAMSMTAPAFAFSGYTYPFAQMPLVHRLYSMLMPSTHYLSGLTGWFYQGSAWRLVFPGGLLIYFLIVSIATVGLALLRARGRRTC